MKKMIYLNKILETFLGRKGRIISMSKSCGPPMAIYNANLVVKNEVLWYGDIDLEEDRDLLVKIATLYNTQIDVYYEHGVRVFPFEAKTATAIKKLQQKRIKKCKPVWTTKDPNKFGDADYQEILAYHSEIRLSNIKDRNIARKVLTPAGTEWTWYNTWYYYSFHWVYRVVNRNINIFILYPLEHLSYVKENANIKISLIEQIKIFYNSFLKEINYHRQEVKDSKISWFKLLCDY